MCNQFSIMQKKTSLLIYIRSQFVYFSGMCSRKLCLLLLLTLESNYINIFLFCRVCSAGRKIDAEEVVSLLAGAVTSLRKRGSPIRLSRGDRTSYTGSPRNLTLTVSGGFGALCCVKDVLVTGLTELITSYL